MEPVGEAVEGVTVRLFKLTENTDFVVGGDYESGEGLIDPAKVANSTNSAADATTGADGKFEISDVTVDAFLATATKDNCTVDIQGFDKESGVLSLDTLLKPDFESLSLAFTVDFKISCADPPKNVKADGSAQDVDPVEPPAPDPQCSEDACVAAGGTCENDECKLPPYCSADVDCETILGMTGSTCENPGTDTAACNPPPVPDCDDTECADAGGTCDTTEDVCVIPPQPACSTDEDCVVALGVEGAYCENPGDVDLAVCNEPDPNEIIPPAEPTGFTVFKIQDANGSDLLDASAAQETSYVLTQTQAEANEIVRVYGEYSGDEETAYVMVQTGSQKCSDLPPKIDFIEVAIVDGKLAGGKGDYVEVYMHGGYMKIQLTTSSTNGEGERSMLVEVGDECQPPSVPLTVILSWEVAEGERADVDLHTWNAAEEQCYYGRKTTDWGELDIDDRNGPGPEVFTVLDDSKGPFVVKVRYFSGWVSPLSGKVRVIYYNDSSGLVDNTFSFTLNDPGDIVDIGIFGGE